MEAIGVKIRRQRRRLGLTLDELSAQTAISKPYLSLIETGRVANPPSDAKLRRLEATLKFKTGELLTQALLHRTPVDVRVMLQDLMSGDGRFRGGPAADGASVRGAGQSTGEDISRLLRGFVDGSATAHAAAACQRVPILNLTVSDSPDDTSPMDRVLHRLLCPEIQDEQAFAIRVEGDSMTPRYVAGDIVIFSPAAPVRDGDDCFVRLADGQSAFRRVFFEGPTPLTGPLRLQPRNERHKPQTLEPKEVAGLYRAVARYEML